MKTDSRTPASFAYVIGPAGSAVVKIGKADDVNERLASIQRMSPVVLQVLAQFEGGFELETALHRHFKHLRTHGEWFAFGDLDPVTEVTAAVEHIQAAAERKQAAAEAADQQATRRADLSKRIQEAARVIRANDLATEQLVLEAHREKQSLRQIAKDAGMTPEGVRKMIARVERDSAETAEDSLGISGTA